MFRSIILVVIGLIATTFATNLNAQTYPCQQANPVTDGFTAVTNTSTYNFAYRFTASVAGMTVVRLGANFPSGATSAITVTLFDYTSQAVLGQAVCGPGAGWQFTNLSSPVILTQGSDYVVSGNTNSGYYYHASPPATWRPTGNITYVDARYSKAASPTAFPTTVASGTYLYGVVDIGYIQGLTITTPSNLPNAGEGVSYNQTIQADFGQPAYSWQLLSGTLPSGLSLAASGNDYILSGTPAYGQAGTYNFTLRVTDTNSDTHTKAMTLVVDQLLITNANPLADGRETVAYNETFTAINGPFGHTWSMISGTLPAGLTLTPSGNNYQLGGTPAAGSTGNYTFELQVIDNQSTVATKTFDLYIDWAPGALTYPLTQQDPLATGFSQTSSASPYNRGWRFTCNSGGISVVRLGSHVPVASASTTKTVTLWDHASQAVLGQVTTGPGTGWQWTDLPTPVLLNNGSDYVICVHSTNGYYYDSTAASSWLPTGDITYVQYMYGSTATPSTFPTTPGGTDDQYGVCDFGYIKGLTVITDAQLPSGAEGTAYTTNIEADFGTPAYSWTPVSGTLPNGLSLATVGNDFVLSGTPATGSLGSYSFTVRVTDAVSDTFDKTMSIFIMPPPASMPFTDDFSTDQGWQLDAEWQRAPAVAYSASGPPRTEPGTDHSPSADNNILGHLIGADYAASMPATLWATSPPVDCTAASFVAVRFERWMGCSLGDTAKIQVSSNGVVWHDVWSSPTSTNTNDSAWTFTGYDISTWAAGNAVVQVRFGIGPTQGIVNTGWCIDDFEILAPGAELEVREGSPTGTIITDDEAVGGLRDFGQVIVGQTSSTLYISLYNNSSNTITLGAYNKVGADPGDFFVVFAPASSIAPGNYTHIEIQFYRTTAGVSTCTIELPHNAAGSGTTPFEINLRGEAIANNPQLQVDLTTSGGTNIPHQASPTGTARDFGNVTVGSSSAPITIVLTNVGTGPLTISQVDMGGTWWTEFTVNNSGSMPIVLSNAQTYSFTVAFQPTTTGLKDAFVRVYHNGVVSPSPYEVPVLGNATTPGGPVINVDDGAGIIGHNAAAAGNRDFGNILVGNSSAPTTITVTNNGVSVLTVGAPALGGANPGEFQLSAGSFGPTIAVGNSSSFTVTFVPTSVGTKTATVTFTHDDTNVTSPFIINLTGNGVLTTPVMVVRETNAAGTILTNPAAATGILDFGSRDVTAGPTASSVIYVENIGTAVLTLGTPVFNPVGNTEFTIDTTTWPTSIATGNNASFSIAFDPTSNGPQTGVIEFTHNDTSAGSPFVINVTGDGVSPLVEVREGSTTGPVVSSGDAVVAAGGRDLGSIDVSAGATATKTIVIVNAGAATMNLGTPTMGGTHAADFILNTTGMSLSLAPAANTTFTVAFDPTLAGIKDAEIQFTHNDTSSPNPYIVPVRGTATDPTAVLITTGSLPSGTSGVVYPSATLAAIQGTAPYTWSMYSGIMPPGLSISPAGVISGTPTTLVTTVYTFTVRVTDATSATNEKQFTITISGSIMLGGGGGGGGGCSADNGTSNVWIGLLSLLAISGLIYRRRQTA
ncbi:MAG: choice-of-anchor D domain-containing protein [Planctomycetota bacterium]|jgi:hypothetical protein